MIRWLHYVIVCLLAAATVHAAPGRRPNVVLFLTDDQGYGDLGFHGNPHVKTPQLDAFAREAVELARVTGVGPAKAARLAAAFEIGRRLRARTPGVRVVLSAPADVYAAFGPLMEDLRREVFRVALLDAQNGLLRDQVISEGTLSASLVHPREVFKPAILESAASVILLHNHPSGDPTPSREDIRLTRQLVECARLLELRVHDHVVIGRGRYVSLAERGII